MSVIGYIAQNSKNTLKYKLVSRGQTSFNWGCYWFRWRVLSIPIELGLAHCTEALVDTNWLLIGINLFCEFRKKQWFSVGYLIYSLELVKPPMHVLREGLSMYLLYKTDEDSECVNESDHCGQTAQSYKLPVDWWRLEQIWCPQLWASENASRMFCNVHSMKEKSHIGSHVIQCNVWSRGG